MDDGGFVVDVEIEDVEMLENNENSSYFFLALRAMPETKKWKGTKNLMGLQNRNDDVTQSAELVFFPE